MEKVLQEIAELEVGNLRVRQVQLRDPPWLTLVANHHCSMSEGSGTIMMAMPKSQRHRFQAWLGWKWRRSSDLSR